MLTQEELKKLTYHVVGGDTAITRTFDKEGLHEVDNILNADIVVFSGGADIDPKLYNQKNVASSTWPKRDEYELEYYLQALDQNKFLAGICRGGQLLNVMNQGSMWQHVDRHNLGMHAMIEKGTGRIIQTTSVHHQMMRPGPDAEIVAFARESTLRKDDATINRDKEFEDAEVIWYGKERALCFQGHPEYGHTEATDYFFELIRRFYGE